MLSVDPRASESRARPLPCSRAGPLWVACGGRKPQLLPFEDGLSPSETSVSGADDRLGAISKLQLVENVGDVIPHSLGAEGQPLGDFGVPVPLGDQLENLALARAQFRE